jgi:hypothetical protein
LNACGERGRAMEAVVVVEEEVEEYRGEEDVEEGECEVIFIMLLLVRWSERRRPGLGDGAGDGYVGVVETEADVDGDGGFTSWSKERR